MPDLATWFRIYRHTLGRSLQMTNDPDFDPAYKDVYFGSFDTYRDGTAQELELFLRINRTTIIKAMKNQHHKTPSVEYQYALKSFRRLIKE